MEDFCKRVATYPGEHFKERTIRVLAHQGFYYDDETRVSKCYQCGNTLRSNVILTHNDGCSHPRHLRMQATFLNISPGTDFNSSSFIGRLLSFSKGWKCLGEIGPDEIACAGFRFTGRGDILQCPFCQIIVHHTSYPTISISDHRQLNIHCPFVSQVYQEEDPSIYLAIPEWEGFI